MIGHDHELVQDIFLLFAIMREHVHHQFSFLRIAKERCSLPRHSCDEEGSVKVHFLGNARCSGVAASVISEHSDCDGWRAKARNKINIPLRGHKWPLFHKGRSSTKAARPRRRVGPDTSRFGRASLHLFRNLLASGFSENSNREIRRRSQFLDRRLICLRIGCATSVRFIAAHKIARHSHVALRSLDRQKRAARDDS